MVNSLDSKTVGKIIHGSKDAHMMVRAMCGESYSNEKKIEKKTKEPIFTSHSQLLYLSAALGLIIEKKLESPDKKAELVRYEYLTSNKNWIPFVTLIKAKFDLTNDKEIVDLFIQYAEAGIRILYNEYRKTGQIDFLQLSKT